MIKAVLAIILVAIVVAVVVFVFVLGGSDDEGGENVIPIQVNNATNLGALHIELVYDSSVLEATDVKLGDLGDNAQVNSDLRTPGRAVIGIIDAMGMNGSGVIVEVHFDEIISGETSMKLENVMATDAETLYDLVVNTVPGFLDTAGGDHQAPVINLGL